MADKGKPVLILGTYAFAEEVHDLISETPGWHAAGFVENLDRTRCETPLFGKPVYWVDELASIGCDHHLVCAIGTTKRHRYIEQVAPAGLPFATIVHPTAHVSATSRIGEGVIVGAGAIVASNSDIGTHTILNRGVMIGHHTRIGSFVTISPGANVAGKCILEDRCYIAMSAIVLDGRRIGKNSIVAAGSIVTRDVPPAVQVVGSPARVVKENIDGL